MPMGPSAWGAVHFTAVKLVGCSAAVLYLARDLQDSRPQPLLLGALRTALGIGVGVACGSFLLGLEVTNAELGFPIGLLPVRALECFAVRGCSIETRP